MSFDPYGQPEQHPSDRPPLRPEDDTRTRAAARERLLVPAILLIAISVLNLLMFVYFIINALYTTLTPADELVKTQVAMYEEMAKSDSPLFKQMGKTQLDELRASGPDGFKNKAVAISWSIAIGSLIAPVLLGLLGGISMLRLRAFGLALTGAITAAIPFLTAGSCCCAGEAVGIWCIVVLVNADVRAAFR